MTVSQAKVAATQSSRESLNLAEVTGIARTELSAMTELPFDGIAGCERDPDGTWLVLVEVIESPARMGENDLLAAYEMRIAPDGLVQGVTRTGRYRREDSGVA